MYHEFRNVNRSGWKYTYTGKDLLPYAKKRLAEYYAAESEARSKMSELIKDMRRSQDDSDIVKCRQAIESNGSQREELMVFVHEFSRQPEKEHYLALGDVVFFGLLATPEEMLRK
jgi:hypothetical protein